MGVKKIQISDENWMNTFNRIHNPWIFKDEKKTQKKKTQKKKTDRKRYTAQRHPVFKISD